MPWSFNDESTGLAEYFDGRYLYWFHPSVVVTSLGVEGDGRTLWRLSEPMAGVVLISPTIVHNTIDLPNGVRVELIRESVPGANLLGIDDGGHLIDKCNVLRISSGGSTLAEGRWQFNLYPGVDGDMLRLSAGLFVGGGTLRVYAHVGNIPGDSALGETALETSPEIKAYPLPFRNGLTIWPSQLRNNGPFGRGISVYADCPGSDPQGVIDIRSHSSGFGDFSAGLFSHPWPLDETIPLTPSALSINDRDQRSLAWGRHPAAMAIGPVGWRLSDLETDGHPEWGRGWRKTFAGASRLFNGCGELALVPASSHRSNVSPSNVENVRLKTLRVSWTWMDGVTTGSRDIGLLFGAWNENRMVEWGSQTGTVDRTPATGTGEANGAFIAAAVTRIDATNLGSAIDQADAVEITRYALRWFAAVRYRYGDDLALTGWRYTDRSVILSTVDAGKLLNGEAVTIAQPTFEDPAYLQGTYPAEIGTEILGTFTIQAIGS